MIQMKKKTPKKKEKNHDSDLALISNYSFSFLFSLLVSMAPLSNEIRPVTSCCPPHFGPAVPEVNSVWFKLFIYDQVKSGPPSLLLVKGTRLRWLPKIFEVTAVYDKNYTQYVQSVN